jgi:hypothetical protein
MLEDRPILAKSRAEQLGISHEWVGSIIHEDLDMQKLINRVLFLHYNAPAHQALATRNRLAYLGFQCLEHPIHSPDMAPMNYHLFSGLKKQLRKFSFFRPTRRSFLLWRPGWTDNLISFEWLAKVTATG